MFQKNRLALLRLQEEEKEKAQHFRFRTTLPTDTGVDLKTLTSISLLKHSGLPLDFFDSLY